MNNVMHNLVIILYYWNRTDDPWSESDDGAIHYREPFVEVINKIED